MSDRDRIQERLRRFESAFQRIALELEELGIGTGLLPKRAEAAELPDLHRLTRRELEVLRSFLGGKEINAVAEHLQIAVHTVRNHLKSIFRKLGVRSQTELLQKFVQVPKTLTRSSAE